ncbi:hypothetical protein ACFQY4_18265 [Catellatospora bangladeshensis]|uniref:Uncharacterized protein n=1 Tax=Catellatospora bangladeshensis TaxID=310355 RepID=A0A8J3JCX1_9ACTN|nr:hypothetical protein [Catellatospora bangladeshensis]GIF82041.1 hypothetical protein Cba03nite_33900 [Catellatospora bangladeshensis]
MSLVVRRSCFDAVQERFLALVEAGQLPLPPELESVVASRVGLPQLRDLMLGGAVGDGVADRLWRGLVQRSRLEAGAWTVAALGMALPGLRRVARDFRSRWRGDVEDLESELFAGFLDRLRTVDIEAPRICGRLIDAAVRAVRRAEPAGPWSQQPSSLAAGPAVPGLPWDHPDYVLARAVAAAVLCREEADVIGATRLGDTTLGQAASALGLAEPAARRWRRQAELRLRGAIRSGELAFVAKPRRLGRQPAPASAVA